LAVQPSECVATIGSFDGVHLGHQSLLKRIVSMANQQGLPSVAIVFEPLPKEYFGAPYQRLSSATERVRLLEEQGIDKVLVIAFNRVFQQMSAEYFVSEILAAKLKVAHLVVGDDFRFGKGRTGDFALLQEMSAKHGYQVEDSASFCVEGERVSSTLIREALANNDLANTHLMLGREYSAEGKVIHGKKLGRTIGFATANVNLKGKPLPLKGVYAVTMNIDTVSYQGVANVGIKPTVLGTVPSLEVHLFNFAQELYGKRVRVTFKQFIRAEQKFESIDALRAQIDQDAHVAQEFFKVNSIA